MNPSTLHSLWTEVEEIQTSDLLKLSDLELVQLLVSRLRSKKMLNREEVSRVSEYLHSKTLLIRDIAQTRIA